MIPKMKSKWGLYWDQPPDITEAPMDETHVILTPAQFARLPVYDVSVPTGVYPGKCWRSLLSDNIHVLRWYHTPKDGFCPILSRDIIIVEK